MSPSDGGRTVHALSYDETSSAGSVQRVLDATTPSPVVAVPRTLEAAQAAAPTAAAASSAEAKQNGDARDDDSDEPASITPSSVADSLSPADLGRVISGQNLDRMADPAPAAAPAPAS